jgi:hypothetical protein
LKKGFWIPKNFTEKIVHYTEDAVCGFREAKNRTVSDSETAKRRIASVLPQEPAKDAVLGTCQRTFCKKFFGISKTLLKGKTKRLPLEGKLSSLARLMRCSPCRVSYQKGKT